MTRNQTSTKASPKSDFQTHNGNSESASTDLTTTWQNAIITLEPEVGKVLVKVQDKLTSRDLFWLRRVAPDFEAHALGFAIDRADRLKLHPLDIVKFSRKENLPIVVATEILTLVKDHNSSTGHIKSALQRVASARGQIIPSDVNANNLDRSLLVATVNLISLAKEMQDTYDSQASVKQCINLYEKLRSVEKVRDIMRIIFDMPVSENEIFSKRSEAYEGQVMRFLYSKRLGCVLDELTRRETEEEPLDFDVAAFLSICISDDKEFDHKNGTFNPDEMEAEGIVDDYLADHNPDKSWLEDD